MKNVIYKISLIFLLITIIPNQALTLSTNWSTPIRSIEGKQYWDIDSIKFINYNIRSVDSILELFTEQSSTEKIEYKMLIDCEKNLYKDIYINNVKQSDNGWISSEGDKLTKEMIKSVCEIHV